MEKAKKVGMLNSKQVYTVNQLSNSQICALHQNNLQILYWQILNPFTPKGFPVDQ